MLRTAAALLALGAQVQCAVGDDATLTMKSPPGLIDPAKQTEAEKLVFAHFMLCFAAFGEKGNSSNATAGYQQEMAVAQANGLDG